MIIKTSMMPDGTIYRKIMRQKWTEYFAVEVHFDVLTAPDWFPTYKILRQHGYILSSWIFADKACKLAVNLWAYPFVECAWFLQGRWFAVGRCAYRKGWIKRKSEGSNYHWFWPIYLISNFE